MSRYPVYRNYRMAQPTAQSWEPAQSMPTYYKAAFDMYNTEELPINGNYLYSTAMFKRFINNVLTNPKNYEMVHPTAQSWEARESPLPAQFVPTYYKAADLRFKRFLDDILASKNQGNPTWPENLTLNYA